MARTLNLIVSLLLFLLTAKVSFADPSSPIPPSIACRSTPDPQFCKSVLPTMQNTSNSLYYYSRFSLLKSLSNAKKWYTKLQDYLNDHTNNARLSPAATSAIKDCLMLSGLNIEYLNSAIKTLNSTDSNTLLDPNVDTLQTLLSALLTNHQTCADGLVANSITIPSIYITDCSKFYSLSLALYTNAWNPNGTRNHFHNGFTTRKVLKNPNVKSMRPGGRRLLQAILVYGIAVVSKNGGSNYNTIGAAVAAAPKYLDGTKGYFLIYVMAGVYNEYISIARSQSYLMIVGGGIGRTVITGNRNAGPIWSTFSSATFGTLIHTYIILKIFLR
ncbi:pectinesterase/pectinesterase inhibitor 41 [Carex littledalei]|uniref:Pectinesterase/pectinesterase inhibitor 41 n=1 Tax=Carex littledalei TaxID=544730 RepID=A0A833VY46_9POAL|nr:pectinesterase/pectinesterase inhibitor 41 [Carex littledalei]